MEEKNRCETVNKMMVQGVACIVDVRDFRSLGYWINNSVSYFFKHKQNIKAYSYSFNKQIIKFSINYYLMSSNKVHLIQFVDSCVINTMFKESLFREEKNGEVCYLVYFFYMSIKYIINTFNTF